MYFFNYKILIKYKSNTQKMINFDEIFINLMLNMTDRVEKQITMGKVKIIFLLIRGLETISYILN